jgi:hypothetical protein
MDPTPDKIGSTAVDDNNLCNFMRIIDHKPDDGSCKTKTCSGANVKVKVYL